MTLQNGYKVIYEKAADGKRSFYASTTGAFADAELIAELDLGKYKLIYEKAGQIYGSESGVPAEGDDCFTDFDKVFSVAGTDETTETEPEGETTTETEPEVEGPTYDLPAYEEEDEE